MRPDFFISNDTGLLRLSLSQDFSLDHELNTSAFYVRSNCNRLVEVTRGGSAVRRFDKTMSTREDGIA